jgi:hypothetical protein
LIQVINLYRCLLYLYPAAYRHDFAREMALVFLESERAIRTECLAARIVFYARELSGLLSGALREQVRTLVGSYHCISFGRFDMRPEFRFPRSTVFLMSVILAAVVLTIAKATSIELKYGGALETVWPGLPLFLAVMLGLVCLTVVIVWGILFAMRRTGMHRLANLQNGHEQR